MADVTCVKKKNVSCQLLYNFIEIKCQFLNYYKAPFNLKKLKWQTSNINNKT